MKIVRLGLVTVFTLGLSIGLARTQDGTQQAPFVGQIAYIGADYNVYKLNPEDNSQIQMTDDAGPMRQYQWPTWSTDGRLAYFGLAVKDRQLTTEVYISPDGSTPGESVYQGPEAFNYAYWSPGNCAEGENCRDLSVLLSSSSRGMYVELIRDGLAEISSITAGLGGPPFYYSWSPDGGRMLWQRNNRRFDIYDANADKVTDTLEETPGTMQAPAWSPVDNRLLLGVASSESGTDLAVVTNDEMSVLASDFTGLLSFGWSPDGKRVAYREQTSSAYGALMVVDSTTGETLARSPSMGVIAFFWAPDSRQIAYLTLAVPPGTFEASTPARHVLAQAQPQPVGIAWSILDVDSGTIKQYGSFFPTPEMIYLLQYFDQFAQSHRVWSPDSRQLVYSEVTAEGPIINLLDTTQTGSVPLTVAEGVIGIWSFG